MWILASLLDPGFLKASSSETAECALRILLKLQKAFFLGGGIFDRLRYNYLS